MGIPMGLEIQGNNLEPEAQTAEDNVGSGVIWFSCNDSENTEF